MHALPWVAEVQPWALWVAASLAEPDRGWLDSWPTVHGVAMAVASPLLQLLLSSLHCAPAPCTYCLQCLC